MTAVVIDEEVPTDVSPTSNVRPRLSTPLAALLLLLCYAALSMVNDPSGYLGTDTGGKVVTLEAMVEGETWSNVDVGYWAEQWDPDGDLHPYFGTKPIGDRWIQVTTVPMILASRPLYEVGGYRAALLLPMLGGLATALAAQVLAGQLGADRRSARVAFWIVGLAGPVLIYSLDLWEHTLGLAAMAWAVVLLVRAGTGPDLLRASALGTGAGLLWGLAFSMRTEGLVYGAVLTAAVLIAMAWTDRRVVTAATTGAATVVGLVAAVLTGGWLERFAMGGTFRAERAVGAGSSGGEGWAVRLGEGLETSVGFTASPDGVVLGLVAVVGLALVARLGSADGEVGERFTMLLIAASVPFVIAMLRGPGFISGFLVAAPLSVLGLVAARTTRSAPLWWGAVLALPVVWAFQFVGGAGPQWGGRYVLMSAFLLTVLGVISLPSLSRQAGLLFVVLAVGITTFGMVWMSIRTHSIADAGRELAARDDEVMVAYGSAGFLPREFVADNGDRRWLSAIDEEALERSAEVVAEAGLDRFGVMWVGEADPHEQIGEFTAVGVDRVDLFTGDHVEIVAYER